MSERDTRMRPSSALAWRFLAAVSLLLFYLPLVGLAVGSFGVHEGDGSWRWSLQWYRQVFSNAEILAALGQSLSIAGMTALLAGVLGTLAALAWERVSFKGKSAWDAAIQLPMLMPEIVLGLSLLLWFVLLRITLGQVSMVLAHVTLSVSYVLMAVRARLRGLDLSFEEAARDLGANRFQVFFRITLPLIFPGIFSGAVIAFTLSLDDFLISFFTSGAGTETLPMRIYAMIRYGVSPEIHALSTLLVAGSLVAVLAIRLAKRA